MKLKSFYTLVITIIFFSCENNTPFIDSDNLLLGSWSNATYNQQKITFQRSNSLPKEAYGVLFKANGSFTERSSGFCGTPPLSFFNIDGNWKLNNGLIEISTQSYMGNYGWRILELTEEKLVVTREVTDQEKDHIALMELYNEIYKLSISVSCSNTNDWAFTAYGSKACGGPQGYIAYSTKIDTADFLQKVSAYNEAEKQFNIKWSVISTCDIPAQPKSVECSNGYPVLKY